MSNFSGKFPDHLESFQTIGNFTYSLESFHNHLEIIQTISNFSDNLDSFQTFWKLVNCYLRGTIYLIRSHTHHF